MIQLLLLLTWIYGNFQAHISSYYQGQGNKMNLCPKADSLGVGSFIHKKGNWAFNMYTLVETIMLWFDQNIKMKQCKYDLPGQTLPARTSAPLQFFHRCGDSQGDGTVNPDHRWHSLLAGTYSNLQHHHTVIHLSFWLQPSAELLYRPPYLRLCTGKWSKCCWGCRALTGTGLDRSSRWRLGVGGYVCSCSS